MAFVLAVCVLILDAALPPYGTRQFTSDPVTLANLAEGRIRMGFIRKGMTEEQVRAVLGEPNGCTVFGDWRCKDCFWDHYGVGMYFVDGRVQRCGVFRLVRQQEAATSPP